VSEPKNILMGPVIQHSERELMETFRDFQDPKQEWRRLFSELLGTFFLVLVAAQLALIAPGPHDLAVADDHRADRHVAVFARGNGLAQRQAHELLVFGEDRGARHGPAFCWSRRQVAAGTGRAM